MALQQFVIIKGEDMALTVNLKDKISGNPYSLAGFTGATSYFAAASGGSGAVIGVLLSQDLGRIGFTLTDAFTPGLLAGDELDVEVVVDQGDQRTIAQILGRLQVKERLFA